MPTLRTGLAAVPALVLLAACAGTPPPPPPFTGPAVDVAVTHFPGTPLSGPRPEAPEAADPDPVVMTVLALERLPVDLLEPASLASTLIVAPPDTETLLPAGRLSQDARYGDGDGPRASFEARREAGELGRTVELGSVRGALDRDVTVRLLVSARGTIDHPDRPGGVRPGLTVLLRGETARPSAAPLGIALALDGLLRDEAEPARDLALVEDPGKVESAPEPPARLVVREETVLLRSTPGEDGHRITIVLPTPFEPSGGAGIAVLVDVTPAPAGDDPAAEAHARAVARCRQELAEAAERARDERARGVPPGSVWPDLGEELQENAPPPPRRTLAFLAGRTGAPFAEDVALAAPDEVVAAIGRAVFERLRAAPAWPGQKELAWLLESESYREIAGRASAEGDAALDALLVRHLGEVGRDPALVQEILKDSDGVESLAEQVTQENLIALEDNAPSARLRAYDWLVLRGAAPAGYDPLAPRKERRAALRSALEAAAPQGEDR